MGFCRSSPVLYVGRSLCKRASSVRGAFVSAQAASLSLYVFFLSAERRSFSSADRVVSRYLLFSCGLRD